MREEVNSNLGALLAEVNNAGDYEQLRMFVVAPEPWTIDTNGRLTPTMKIKRARIEPR